MARQGLIVLGHGSRRKEGLQVVEETSACVAQHLGERWQVEAAFLELAEPDLASVLESYVQAGDIKQVVIMPLFLALGMHVAVGLPKLVEELQERFPSLDLLLTDHIGADPLLADIVIKRVEAAL